MKEQDVTQEYLSGATPGLGWILYDANYQVETHRDEIQFARWLYETFGGTICLLTESVKDGEKRADYLWNGKLWDLKSVTTEKAANTAIKRGLAQIKKNPGGLILNYGDHDISMEILLAVIGKRMQWLPEGGKADVLVVIRGEIIKVFRYRK